MASEAIIGLNSAVVVEVVIVADDDNARGPRGQRYSDTLHLANASRNEMVELADPIMI